MQVHEHVCMHSCAYIHIKNKIFLHFSFLLTVLPRWNFNVSTLPFPSLLRVVHKLIGSGTAWIHVSPMAVKTQEAFDKFCFSHMNELRSIYLNNNERNNWHYVHQVLCELFLWIIYFIQWQTNDVYYCGLYLGYQGSETFGNLLIGNYYSGIKICHDFRHNLLNYCQCSHSQC